MGFGGERRRLGEEHRGVTGDEQWIIAASGIWIEFSTRRVVTITLCHQNMWYRSTYLPHVLYSLATTTISIHLVGTRTTCSEERARVNAQISILEDIAQRLRSNESISDDELERLKGLARPAEKAPPDAGSREVIRWGDILWGQKKEGRQSEMSKWDTKDVETGACFFLLPCISDSDIYLFFFF